MKNIAKLKVYSVSVYIPIATNPLYNTFGYNVVEYYVIAETAGEAEQKAMDVQKVEAAKASKSLIGADGSLNIEAGEPIELEDPYVQKVTLLCKKPIW